MKLKLKKWMDYYVGGLLIAMLRPVVILLGILLRRDHTLDLRKSLLFIKLQGGGSLVIAYPGLLALRRKYPEIKLRLLTTTALKPFAETIGVFDEILVLRDHSFMSLFASAGYCLLKTIGTDTCIDFEVYSRLSGVFTLLTLARNRIGFYLESMFWRKGLYTHLVFFNRFSGSFNFYEQTVRLFGALPANHSICREHLKKQLSLPAACAASSSRRIVLAPACSELGRERMLSVDQWRAFFQRRFTTGPYPEFIFVGTHQDLDLSRRLEMELKAISPEIHTENHCGKFPLQESLRVIAQADEFWTIDSGLLHFARILGVHCVSFWGPTDPQTRLKPFDEVSEEVYYKKIPCSPCIHVTEEPPCRGNNVCLTLLLRGRGIDRQSEVPLPVFLPHSRSS
ncbi:MAG: glycosyltransferase family 9 protein [Deltaproteobacteria bacterium]|nr:glycosyltransferase family 9 protein [Deltaproteobacteria bacterium]